MASNQFYTPLTADQVGEKIRQQEGYTAPEPYKPKPGFFKSAFARTTQDGMNPIEAFATEAIVRTQKPTNKPKSFLRKLGEDAIALGAGIPIALSHPIETAKSIFTTEETPIGGATVESIEDVFDPKYYEEHPGLAAFNTGSWIAGAFSLGAGKAIGAVWQGGLRGALREAAIIGVEEATVKGALKSSLRVATTDAIRTGETAIVKEAALASLKRAGVADDAAARIATVTAEEIASGIAAQGSRLKILDAGAHPFRTMGQATGYVTAPVRQLLFGTPGKSAVAKVYGSEVVARNPKGFLEIEQWAGDQAIQRGLKDTVENRQLVMQDWSNTVSEWSVLTPEERIQYHRNYVKASQMAQEVSRITGDPLVPTKFLSPDDVAAIKQTIADADPSETLPQILDELETTYGKDIGLHRQSLETIIQRSPTREALVRGIETLGRGQTRTYRSLPEVNALIKELETTTGYRLVQAPKDKTVIYARNTADEIAPVVEAAKADIDIGITSFRGTPVRTVQETLPYYDTTRSKGFVNSLQKGAEEVGVRVETLQRAAGVWEGNVEPSFSLKVRGDENSVLRYAAEQGFKANQDAVVLFKASKDAIAHPGIEIVPGAKTTTISIDKFSESTGVQIGEPTTILRRNDITDKGVKDWEVRIRNGERPTVLVDRNGSSLEVRDGNHRLQAYRNLGFKEVPVLDNTKGTLPKDFYKTPAVDNVSGVGTKHVFEGVADADGAIALLQESGISGGTIDGARLIVYDEGGQLASQVAALSEKLGIKPTSTNGTVRFLQKSEYGNYSPTAARGVGNDVPADIQTPGIGAADIADSADLIGARTRLGELMDRLGLSTDGTISGNLENFYKDEFAQNAMRTLGQKYGSTVKIGKRTIPITKLYDYLDRKRGVIGGLNNRFVNTTRTTIVDMSVRDLINFGMSKELAKDVVGVARKSLMDIPYSRTGLAEGFANLLRAKLPGYNAFLRTTFHGRFNLNPLYGFQYWVEQEFNKGLMLGKGAVTFGKRIDERIANTVVKVPFLRKVIAPQIEFPEIKLMNDEVLAPLGTNLLDAASNPEVAQLAREAVSGLKSIDETARFNESIQSRNVLMRGIGYNNSYSATAFGKALAEKYGMTLEDALSHKIVNGVKQYNNPEVFNIIKEATEATFGYKPGLLTSPLMKTINVIWFPARFEVKTAMNVANFLSKMSPVKRQLVLNNWLHFANWTQTQEGQTWVKKNASIWYRLANYVFPYEAMGRSVDAALQGKLFGGNTGLIGGMPFGFVMNIMNDLSLIGKDKDTISPLSGQIVKKETPKKLMSAASASVIIEDFLVHMMPSLPLYSLSNGNIKSLRTYVEDVVKGGVGIIDAGLKGKGTDDAKTKLQRQFKKVSPDYTRY